MLHVTNGSVVLSRIHSLGVPGPVVPWDDVLHEGPVPGNVPPAELRRIRAAFLASTFEVAPDETARGLEARDHAVLAERDEVVLWFEHDLYDQLHVLQVLELLRADREAGHPAPRVTAILADDYLAAQSDDTLASWFHRRHLLEPAQWAAAAAAWAAFTAADPSALNAFAHHGAWPTLHAALRRHRQQYPSVLTGLSRTEGQTLAVLTEGPRSLRDLFVAANHQLEEAVFMGDTTWWDHIRPLLIAPRPLLRVEGIVPATLTDADWWRADAAAPRLALTDDGARVVAGEADHVELNGLDRWLGGVHLQQPRGQRHGLWRWNETLLSLQSS
jgi:hypothetical protein